VLRQGALAFCPAERGLLKHSYGLPYVIPVIEHEPWQKKPIPIPAAIKDKYVELVRERIRTKLYEQSTSSYSSPVFCVKKHDGKLWIVHDLQEMNRVTIRDAGLPPATEEFIEAFAGRTCYGRGDIMGGYDKRESTERFIEIKPKQPVQQEDSNQLVQINSRIEELQLTIAVIEDPKFSTTTPINWIQQIIKRKHKIFNKQLCKPHLDLIRFCFQKDLHRGNGKLCSTSTKPGTMGIRLISQPITQLGKSALTTTSCQSKIRHSQNNKITKTDSPQQLKNTDPSIPKRWDPGRLQFLKSRFWLHHNICWPNFKRESKQSNHLRNPVKIRRPPGYETKLFKKNPKININKINKFKQSNKNPLLINHKKHKKKKEKNLLKIIFNKLGEDPILLLFSLLYQFSAIFFSKGHLLFYHLLTWFLS
jgi:hypothetical protein